MKNLLLILIDFVLSYSRKKDAKLAHDAPTEVVKIEVKPKPKNVVDKVKSAASKYAYEQDTMVLAAAYDPQLYDKTACVIHYSATPTLEVLDACSQLKDRNWTWGVAKDGTVHKYLPDVRMTSWTQGFAPNLKGGFIDAAGNWVKNINYLATSFEIVNMGDGSEYTDEQYFQVAVRVLWQLHAFPNFRLWFITGHEHIIPILKNDPGVAWDWEKFFCKYLGVRRDFYESYLKYLQDCNFPTAGDESRSDRKLFLVKAGTDKIVEDLLDKPKEFCF